MRVGDEEEANRERVVPGGDEVAQGGEAPRALRHLLAGRLGQVLRVQPDTRERFAVRRLRLRDLILVVGEHQVDAARVDIERLPEVMLAHRRAFDVPARAPESKGRIPRCAQLLVAGLRLLPQGEVAHRLLVITVSGYPGARSQSRTI